MLLKAVSYKNPNGNYRNVDLEFNDENHFSNWYKSMSKKGYKIITVKNTHDETEV